MVSLCVICQSFILLLTVSVHFESVVATSIPWIVFGSYLAAQSPHSHSVCFNANKMMLDEFDHVEIYILTKFA